jgi:hypothetical protein
MPFLIAISSGGEKGLQKASSTAVLQHSRQIS